MADISVQELKERMDAGRAPKVIDVRETWEFETDHIDAVNIPMGILPLKLDEIGVEKDQELVVCCRSGGRSGRMAMYLQQQGYSQVRNLTGGMLAWKQFVDPDFNVE